MGEERTVEEILEIVREWGYEALARLEMELRPLRYQAFMEERGKAKEKKQENP